MSSSGEWNAEDEERERRSAAAAAYRTYGRISWFRRFINLFYTSSPGNVMAGMLAGIVMFTGSSMLVRDTLKSHFIAREARDAQRTAERRALGDGAFAYALHGRTDFDLLVLSKELTWALGSTSVVTRAGTPMSTGTFEETVLKRTLGPRLTAAGGLIAVGVASAEGDQTAEEARALARARQVAAWLGDVAPGKPAWTLNLGQYRKACETCETAETSWQRPIIIIAVKNAAVQDLSGALAEALKNATNLPGLDSYTRFDLARVR